MRLFFLLAMFVPISALAREWRSADGSKTIEAAFGGLKDDRVLLKLPDGKASVLALTALSTSDQAFAKVAQVALNGAQVLGPQTLEVQSVVEGGYIARLGSQLQGPKGPWTFSGETFFLPKGSLTLEKGDKLESQTLYYAGNRTFQPIEGDSAIIRAFDLKLEDAVNAELRIRTVAGADPAKLAPLIAEPLIEHVSTRGLALPLGKGYFVTEADLIADTATLVLHEEGRDIPVKVLKKDDKLGLALISAAVEMEPAKLSARLPAVLGQSIYALSLSLTKSGKDLGAPSLTRGIISKASSSTTFDHDAALDPYTVGGYILNDKWEPLGFFFRSQTRTEEPGGTRSSRSSEPPKSLLTCIRSETLEKLLTEGEKAEAKRLPGVPSLKPGSLGGDAIEVSAVLKKSTALIVATREIKREPPARKTTTAGGGPPAQPGQLQYNLSGTGIRHNSNCRYFNPNKLCQPTDGRPCKLCGG